jgi:hypothetical protein
MKSKLLVLDDSEKLRCLMRVSVDAFWSREPTTISQNLSKINPALQIAHTLGLKTPPVPKLGPLKLEDEFRAAAAAKILKHSLDPGVTEYTVQFETVRKMKSAFVNMYHASVENESTSIVGGKDGEKQLVLGAPIYHGWYDRAQVGVNHIMGDTVVQDYGLARKAAVAFQKMLAKEWELAATDQEKRMEVAQLACFMFLGYGRALRGEERRYQK